MGQMVKTQFFLLLLLMAVVVVVLEMVTLEVLEVEVPTQV
jgi:hypothetical protein